MKILALLFALLLSLGNAFSQESIEDYEFLASAQSVVIENTELVNLHFQNKLIQAFVERPELLTDEDPTKLIEAIEELASQGLPNKVKLKFSVAVRKPFIKIAHEVRTIVRKYGLSAGIAYGALTIAGYVVPVILAAVGQPQLAAIIGTIPVASIFLVSMITVSKFIDHGKMVKLYGGKDQFRYYKKLHKEVNKSLHLKGKSSLIVPLEKVSENELKAVVLSSSNFFDKYISLIDHKRSKLDVRQFKYFMDENEAWDATLSKIKSSGVSDELKVASMLHYIQVTNPNLYAEIQMAFPKSFVIISKFDFSQDLKNWTLAVAHAESKQELEETVPFIPIGARILDVVKIWAKCVVPHLIEDTKGLSISSYQALSKSLMALEISAELNPAKLVDESWRNEFLSYLQTTLVSKH